MAPKCARKEFVATSKAADVAANVAAPAKTWPILGRDLPPLGFLRD